MLNVAGYGKQFRYHIPISRAHKTNWRRSKFMRWQVREGCGEGGGAICVALTSGNTDKVLSSPEGKDEFYDAARQLYATPQQSHKERQPATAT